MAESLDELMDEDKKMTPLFFYPYASFLVSSIFNFCVISYISPPHVNMICLNNKLTSFEGLHIEGSYTLSHHKK
jgi:hypothetical protein